MLVFSRRFHPNFRENEQKARRMIPRAAGPLRTVGDFAIDAESGTRGYTTRAREEQRRTAAPVFSGRVRRWEKRWVSVGHMVLLRWERAESDVSQQADESEAA